MNGSVAATLAMGGPHGPPAVGVEDSDMLADAGNGRLERRIESGIAGGERGGRHGIPVKAHQAVRWAHDQSRGRKGRSMDRLACDLGALLSAPAGKLARSNTIKHSNRV